MTVKIVRGDIFTSRAEAIVSPVNTRGVSGAGLAKEFARRYPLQEREFAKLARAGKIWPGSFLAVRRNVTTRPLYIVYIPTKCHWRESSSLQNVRDSLVALRSWRPTDVKVIAMPALGCGLGGLLWAYVKEQVIKVLDDAPWDVRLYEPM